MAAVVVQSQSLDVDLAWSRQVRTAQVDNKHAIHEDPHVIVTSEFEHFRSRSLVRSLVLEACITHHGKGVIAEMLQAEATVHHSGLPSCAMATTVINSTRATLIQPILAKLSRILVQEVGLRLGVLVVVRRAENRESLRVILVTHTVRLDRSVTGLVHHPFSCSRVDAIQRRVTTIVVVVVVNVVLGTSRIPRDIHRRVDTLVLARHVEIPLFKELVIATFIHLADDNTVIHINLAIGTRRSKHQIGVHHARRVNNRVSPDCTTIRAFVTTHVILGILVTTLRPSLSRLLGTFTILQDRTSRNSL